MKRANGTGSVVKLSGNRRRPWAVKVSGRNRYGHVIQKIVSYHEKASEAQLALEEYNRTRASDTAPSVDKLALTVADVFEAWKAREYRKLKPASISSHNAAWNKRVSRFGPRKMRDMTLDEWQSLLDEDEDTGLSQSTINNDALLIKALYGYAMERDIVGKDYSRYLDIPSVGAKRPRDALNDLQLSKLTQLAAGSTPWADTALMLCYTGFRVSEFLQLTRFSYHSEDGGYLQGGSQDRIGQEPNRTGPPKNPSLSHAVAGQGRGYHHLRRIRQAHLQRTIPRTFSPNIRPARRTGGHTPLVPPYLRHSAPLGKGRPTHGQMAPWSLHEI